MVSGPTPPSTWMLSAGNAARTSATLGMMSCMKLCPPKPGSTVMHSTRSTSPAYSITADAGVFGFSAIPAPPTRSPPRIPGHTRTNPAAPLTNFHARLLDFCDQPSRVLRRLDVERELIRARLFHSTKPDAQLQLLVPNEASLARRERARRHLDPELGVGDHEVHVEERLAVLPMPPQQPRPSAATATVSLIRSECLPTKNRSSNLRVAST
eukprot:446869-Rhodomonas_salina.1